MDFILFLKAMFMNPRTTGAIWPSSKRLAREMASHIIPNEGYIIELGAGTGVITTALIQAGVSPEKIIAIEYSDLFVNKLRERFPDVQVIQGDAAELIRLLGDKKIPVSAVISSLPLRSFPKIFAQTVLNQVSSLLSTGGKYIQFTYYFCSDSLFTPGHFKEICSKVVWRNIPPARVDVFAV